MLAGIQYVGNVQKGLGVPMCTGCGTQESTRSWYDYTSSYLKGEITIDEWADKQKANLEANWAQMLEKSNISEADLDSPQNEPAGN